MPKEFIKKVLIDNIGDLVAQQYFWLAFTLIAIGIEFLGKCLDVNEENWDRGKSRPTFERAIEELSAFNSYRRYLIKYEIWDSYRNGFAHSFVQKKPIGLSSGNEIEHLTEYKDENGLDSLNFRCEDLYDDFEKACIEIINKEFEESNKMNSPLLCVPDLYKR